MKKEIKVREKLKNYPEVVDELKTLAKSYNKLLVTRETFNEAKKARLTLRDRRFEIQNVRDGNRDILNAMKKENLRLADNLIKIILPVEENIDTQIKKIEAEKEAEKEARRKEREQALENQLNLYRGILGFNDRLISNESIESVQNLIIEAEGLKITKKAYGQHYDDAIKQKFSFIEKANGVVNQLVELQLQKDREIMEDLVAARVEYRDYFETNAADDKTAEELRELIAADKEKVKKEKVVENVETKPVEEKSTTMNTPAVPPNAIDPKEIKKVKEWKADIQKAIDNAPKGINDYGLKKDIFDATIFLESAVDCL